MRRIIASIFVLSLLAVAIGGCELAEIRPPGSGNGGDGGPLPDAETYFDENVVPILEAECSSCHEGQRGVDIQFLAEGNPSGYYASVTGYTTTDSMPLFIAGDPDSSKIILHPQGSHSGGPYEAGSEATVRTWIELEAGGGPTPDAGPGMMDPVQTDPVLITERTGISIPLSSGTVMLTDSFFTFDAAFNGTDLIMTNIAIEAGPRGISVTQPLLYIWEDGASMGTPDPNTSRFNQSNFQVGAASREPLADREVVPNFPMNGSLSVQFDTVQYMN